MLQLGQVLVFDHVCLKGDRHISVNTKMGSHRMHDLQAPQLHPFHSPLLPNPCKFYKFFHYSYTCCSSSSSIRSITDDSSPKQPLRHSNKSRIDHPLPSFRTQTKLWNSRIESHLQKGQYKNCISLYYQMLDEQITPTPSTLAYVLKACSSLSDLKTLRLLHNDSLQFRFESHGKVAAALLDGYIKCGSPEVAHQLFDRMSNRDIVSWTIIISQCYKCGQFEKAMCYFRAMVEEGVSLDEVAVISILSAITQYGCLRQGSEVHGYLIRNCVKLSKVVIGSLANMYVKHGRMDCANRIVNQTAEENVVAWTAMMSGLAHTGNATDALLIFQKMMSSGIEPTEKTISGALGVVCQLGFLRLGIQIHGYIIKKQFELDEYILSGLIDMYAICGAPTHLCQQLFDQIIVRDVVSWTAMILAYGRQGQGHASLRIFDDMRASGIYPDSVAFTAVLSACCFSGMLHEGLGCFNSMVTNYKIKPREEHYACLMGLIAKDGRLEEAYEAIETMALRDDGRVWEAFLGACKVHGNVDYGEMSVRKLLEIEPGNPSAHIILSHIYSAIGRWEDADSIMSSKSQRGLICLG